MPIGITPITGTLTASMLSPALPSAAQEAWQETQQTDPLTE